MWSVGCVLSVRVGASVFCFPHHEFYLPTATICSTCGLNCRDVTPTSKRFVNVGLGSILVSHPFKVASSEPAIQSGVPNIAHMLTRKDNFRVPAVKCSDPSFVCMCLPMIFQRYLAIVNAGHKVRSELLTYTQTTK